MKLKIVFLDQYTVNDSDLSPIKTLGDYTGYDFTEPGQIIERCQDADVVITNKMPFQGDTFKKLPKLKLLCIAATGMNNVDLEAAAEAGVAVRNAVDYSTHSVAEHTFCGVLALLKQSVYMDDFVKSGRYTASGKLFDFTRPTYELFSKRWGIIGLGHIGRQVALLARAFGCAVSYYSTSGKNKDPEFQRLTLDELLSQSDIVSIHAPLNQDTYHLLDYPRLCLMKPTAILSNVARGSLVDEAGLTQALNENRIAGAAIDVYSDEPMRADNPLRSVKDPYKLLLSPHSAWSTEEALQILVNKVADNIRRFEAEGH